MSLRKVNIPVNVGFGLDQKTDEKQVVPGKLLLLQNAVFRKTYQLSKRFGYDKLSSSLVTGGAFSRGSSLNVWNNELNLCDGTNFYTYLESADKWIDKGNAVSCILQSTQVIRNENSYANVTSAVNSNLVCLAYEVDTDIKVTIKDLLTGATILYDELVSSTGVKPLVIAYKTSFVIFYTDSGSLFYRRIIVSSPTTIQTEVELLTNLDSSELYDACVNGEYIWVTYNNDTTELALVRINYQFSASSEEVVDPALADTCLTIFSDDDQNVWISWFDGTDVLGAVWDYGFNEVLPATTVTGTPGDVLNIVGTASGTTAKIVYELDAVASYNHYCELNTLTIAGTAGTASDFKRSVGLASKFFKYNDVAYVTVLHESTLQSTYFLIDENKNIIGKIAQNNGGELISDSPLTIVDDISIGNFLLPNLVKSSVLTEDTLVFTNLGIQYTSINFESGNKFQNTELSNLFLVGGIVQSYDGISLTEHGFNLFPENISNSPATSGGNIENGTRQYVVCYEWTDNLGQIYRSAPSPALSVTNTGSNVSENTLTIPTLRLTAKSEEFGRYPVSIVVYRTEAAGTVYYRVSSVTSPLLNDTTVDTVTYVDEAADTTIISNNTLYTTGGVVENICPPAASMITTFKNQVVLGGLEDPLQLWISKFKKIGSGVEFSDFMVIDVDARGGPITALTAMDDKLIIFKETSIYLVTGDGYNDTLTQNTLSQPILINTDVGCVNINSVVITPEGIMFKSAKGIYRLSRSLATDYVGAAVEDFNDLEISSAQSFPVQNEVRFTTVDDVCLVYNTFFDQWSTFTNHEAEDSQVWQNTEYVYLKSDGSVFLQNNERFDDNGQFVPLKLITSWLSFDKIQALQRVYRLLIIGEFKSLHKLRVRVRYDFNSNFQQDGILDLQNLETSQGYPFDQQTYGESSPYGSEEVYGGAFPLYQFRVNLKQQKCESVSFMIEDVQDGTTLGESMTITNLLFVVGAKRRDNPMAKGRSLGVS